jgi:hypothetical protein
VSITFWVALAAQINELTTESEGTSIAFWVALETQPNEHAA